MKVETIITKDNRERYILVDNNGELVLPVNRFLKFKDNAGKARNTLRAYCYHLCSFFNFLEQKNISYENVGIEDIATFMRWLQTVEKNDKIINITGAQRKISNTTINTYVSTVTEFYDFLMRSEGTNGNVSDNLRKTIKGSQRGYKDFLYHINKDKDYKAKYLKLREEKKQIVPLTKEQVTELINACNNKRDKFLLKLLWETGFRIGEALSLWLEDFMIDARKIALKDRGELQNNAEIKTVTSPRKVDISAELINDYFDYIADYHTDEIDTNFVFFKLSGNNRGEPMEYTDVDSLFKRLRKKTGIYVTPHLFRHSHFDLLRRNGWSFEQIQKRGGWANVQTPMQTYSHPQMEEIRESWEHAEKQFTIKSKEDKT